MFIVFHDLSLFISVRAFLPSLRVLLTNQESEVMMRIMSVIREIRLVSMLFVNLLKLFQRL